MKLNIANKLTLLRVLLVPVFVFFYLIRFIPSPLREWICLAIFVIASLTDMIDGRLARKMNIVTDFGKFMDPLADKLLVCSALILFVSDQKVAVWIVLILIAREFIISGFRLVAAGKGVVIAAGIWGKLKTTVQMCAVVGLLAPITWPWYQILCQVLIYISAVLSIISVVDYIWKNKSVLA